MESILLKSLSLNYLTKEFSLKNLTTIVCANQSSRVQSTGGSIALVVAIATDSSSQFRIRPCIRSSAMLDFSALKPSTPNVFPSSVEPHLYAAPSFQLPAVADVAGFQKASIQMVKPAKGTTSLAFVFEHGVIVAADSPASIDYYSSSQPGERIVKLNSHMLATKAGFSADCQFWLGDLRKKCRLHELNYKRCISLCAASKLLSNTLYSFKRGWLPLSMGTIIAGWDEVGPGLYYVDSKGGRVKGTRFSVGSGSTYTYGVLDSG